MCFGLRLHLMRKLATLLVSGLFLAGCASPAEETTPADDSQGESQSQEDSQNSASDGTDAPSVDEPGSSDSTDPDTPDVDDTNPSVTDPLPDLASDEYQTIDDIEQAAIIAANTFDRFDKEGIVETLRGGAGDVVLVHNPDQKDQYSAAWINTNDNSAELIFDTRDFTSAWPFLLLSEPDNLENTYFGGQPGGFTLEYEDPSFGRYGYNYLTDGEYLLGAWWYLEPEDPSSAVLITYDFEVRDKWKDRLDEAVEDFLSEQPAE